MITADFAQDGKENGRSNGVTISVYFLNASFSSTKQHAAVLRDYKRALDLRVYLMGWASEEDVLRELNKPDHRGVKLRAREEVWKKLGSQFVGVRRQIQKVNSKWRFLAAMPPH